MLWLCTPLRAMNSSDSDHENIDVYDSNSNSDNDDDDDGWVFSVYRNDGAV